MTIRQMPNGAWRVRNTGGFHWFDTEAEARAFVRQHQRIYRSNPFAGTIYLDLR